MKVWEWERRYPNEDARDEADRLVFGAHDVEVPGKEKGKDVIEVYTTVEIPISRHSLAELLDLWDQVYEAAGGVRGTGWR